jgi:glycosyltransferase involved in cell wall biosynthesis
MRFLVESLGLTAGGGKEVGLNLLTELRKRTDHHFAVLAPDLPEYRSVCDGNFSYVRYEKARGLAGRWWLLNREVPRLCCELEVDALLCLSNFFPRRLPCPTVVLLQNAYLAQCEKVAEKRLTFREKLSLRYGRMAYRRLPPRLSVIVQTPVMKGHVELLCGVDPRRISVIPNACLPEDDGVAHARREPRPSDVPFTFLCLARYYAHKNIEILVDAMVRLPVYARRPARCHITISSGQHPRAMALLRRLGRTGLADRIINIGPVPSTALPEAFRRADALLFPTLLESFSRTYHEAMQADLPILTSDRDFAHEICQEAAVYFEPLDADSVAKAMALVMEDADLRARLVANGRRVLAKSPTWEEIVSQFVEVLERAARGERVSPELAAGAPVSASNFQASSR